VTADARIAPPFGSGPMEMAAPAIAVPKQESFRLEAAGSGVTAPLRYALRAGTASYTVTTRLTSRQIGKAKPEPLPAITDGFAITVSDAALALRALPAATAAPNPTAEQYASRWRALLENRRITAVADARGQLGELRFLDDPDNRRSSDSRDELAQRLLALSVPVPDEPIGVGARWQVVTVLRQSGAYLKQTATYTLRERTDQRWRVHVKLLRVGEQQTLLDPRLPPGASVDLVAVFRLLEGELDVDPGAPLAVGGKLSVESRVHARIAVPGREVEEQFTEDLGTLTLAIAR
jgi:hypothetical protein